MVRRKAQKDQVNYQPKDPAAPCVSCDCPSWVRRIPQGDWFCDRCNPYAAMEAKLHRHETYTCASKPTTSA